MNDGGASSTRPSMQGITTPAPRAGVRRGTSPSRPRRPGGSVRGSSSAIRRRCGVVAAVEVEVVAVVVGDRLLDLRIGRPRPSGHVWLFGAGRGLDGDVEALLEDLALDGPVEVEALAHGAGGRQHLVGAQVQMHGREVRRSARRYGQGHDGQGGEDEVAHDVGPGDRRARTPPKQRHGAVDPARRRRTRRTVNPASRPRATSGPTDGAAISRTAVASSAAGHLDGALVRMADAQAPETLLGAGAIGELGASRRRRRPRPAGLARPSHAPTQPRRGGLRPAGAARGGPRAGCARACRPPGPSPSAARRPGPSR